MRAPVRRFLVGSAYFLAGVGVLWLTYPGAFGVDLPLWLLFTAAYVVLSYQSVEVNDRLYASSSVMPVLTAGVAFALVSDRPGIDQSVVFAMTLMAALGPLVPEDLRLRRLFQPAANLGQLAVSAALAGLVIEAVVGDLSVSMVLETREAFRVAVAGSAGAATYSAVNFVLVRNAVVWTYGRRDLIPWSRMGMIVGSQTLMGVLGGLLGAVVVTARPAVVPLILFVYVMGHLSIIAYSRLREAHESTLRGFVKTLETRDLYTRGHTERVAYFSRLIGERLGFNGTQLEQMRWAALIHDVGKLAVPVELMQKRGPLDDDEYRRLRTATHLVDDLLSEVDFLRPMVDIASGCHPRLAGEDFGQVGHTHTTSPSLEQKVLAVADAFDAMTSNRSYRMASSQSRAFAALRRDTSPLFDPLVIDALEQALAEVGQTYGPPDYLTEVGVETGEAAHAHD
ncbi:MAG: metal-dependent phosphohydrolase [Acidimicrobiia bacterium]|nr:MAG: metal-dependent phosphohydrolase [Acidimicrobiia bacterium]